MICGRILVSIIIYRRILVTIHYNIQMYDLYGHKI